MKLAAFFRLQDGISPRLPGRRQTEFTGIESFREITTV
jgi:hypothetical protein